MPDDCLVNDESRRALRNLARQAEWHGHPGPAGAALDARTLRDLGREIELVLARAPEPDPDNATWAHRASKSLAAYSQRAQPDWTVEQIAELTRLREDAMTALAPGPGEPQADPDPKTSRRAFPFAQTLSSLGSRRPAVLALAAVCCLVLIALVLTLPHLLSNNTAQTPTASSTTTIPATETQPTQFPTAPATTAPATGTSTTTPTTPTSPSTSAPTTPASTPAENNSTVTAIQINNVDDLQGNPPEAIVTYTISASGTGNVTVNIAITGSSGQPQIVQQVTESDETSYSDLTQTINLDQWCGQSSVRLTISSGTVSKSSTVAISGC
jgi:hypothetical protein